MSPKRRLHLILHSDQVDGQYHFDLEIFLHGVTLNHNHQEVSLCNSTIHVAHTVIDGAIDHPWIKENFPDIYKFKKKDGILKPNEIAQVYLDLHNQQKSVWTHEIDLRPYMEKF